MSVIFFDAEELGEIVAALPATFDKAHACDVLARYSIANARAFARTYPREPSCDPCTAEEILRASQVSADDPLERWGTRERAESTAELLVYNAVANDGTTFLADIDRAAIVELEIALVRGKP